MPCCFSKSEANKVHFSFGNQHDVPFHLPKEEGDRYLVTFLTCPAPERPKLTGRLVGSSSRHRITWGSRDSTGLMSRRVRSGCAPRRASLVKILLAKMPLLWIPIKCRCPKFQLHLFKLNEDHSFYWGGEKPSCFFSPFYAYIEKTSFLCVIFDRNELVLDLRWRGGIWQRKYHREKNTRKHIPPP